MPGFRGAYSSGLVLLAFGAAASGGPPLAAEEPSPPPQAAAVVAPSRNREAPAGSKLTAAPTAADLQGQVRRWLEVRGLDDPELIAAVDDLWQFGDAAPAPGDLDQALLRSLYLADADVRELIESCRLGDVPAVVRDFPAIASHGDEPLYSHNVRAFYARFLSTATLYEEALALYRDIDLAHLADPGAALFHRSVCEHALLLRDEGLATLDQLLDHTPNVPARRRALGELMRTDLEGLEEKSLGEVARQMSDVRRRLALGRAGERVQRVEDQIIVTLDEIIKKREAEQGGGGSGAQGGRRNPSAPTNPADQSYVGGLQGRGETDKKDIGHKDNWGNLPDKAQAAAKNMLDRQFPAHYRLAVEEYLKRLAERTAPTRE